MNPKPLAIDGEISASKALEIMEERRVTTLVVLKNRNRRKKESSGLLNKSLSTYFIIIAGIYYLTFLIGQYRQ